MRKLTSNLKPAEHTRKHLLSAHIFNRNSPLAHHTPLMETMPHDVTPARCGCPLMGLPGAAPLLTSQLATGCWAARHLNPS
jgi:hypothetical protein